MFIILYDSTRANRLSKIKHIITNRRSDDNYFLSHEKHHHFPGPGVLQLGEKKKHDTIIGPKRHIWKQKIVKRESNKDRKSLIAVSITVWFQPTHRFEGAEAEIITSSVVSTGIVRFARAAAY